jgi:hypothetical protein
MAWPTWTYAATRTLGIYTTDDSLAPGAADPIWVTLNGGLTNTDIRSFCLDRHEAVPDSRMFCIDETSRTLWRRTTGDWAAVLTSADARTTAGYGDGEVLTSVIVDPVTGYVYALLAVAIYDLSRAGVLRSTDHGESWTAYTIVERTYIRRFSTIDAHDGLVVAGRAQGTPMYYSTDQGETWSSITVAENAGGIWESCPRIHPAAGDAWYGNIYNPRLFDLIRYKSDGTYAILQSGTSNGPMETPGGVWPDPDDANHLIVACRQVWMESSDAGATADSATVIPVDHMREIGDGCSEGYWVQGCTNPTYAAHAIRAPVYVSPDGVTLTAKSGANWYTAPYTDSIPVSCGGITPRGLWVVGASPGRWGLYDCVFAQEGA